MNERELAAHDVALVAAVTGEHQAPALAMTGEHQAFGRRATDLVAGLASGVVTTVVQQASSVFDIWKDERGHWSTRRILLWAWTGLGFWLMYSEATARVYVVGDTIIQPHFLSNAWVQAWTVTEGAFIVAVFGPVVADYLKNAAPAITAIGGALRDRVLDSVPVRDPRLPSILDDERKD